MTMCDVQRLFVLTTEFKKMKNIWSVSSDKQYLQLSHVDE